MLTGRQIREARVLTGLQRSKLAKKVGRITTLVIMRAEENEDDPTLSAEHVAAVRQTLERLGVEFTPHVRDFGGKNLDAHSPPQQSHSRSPTPAMRR